MAVGHGATVDPGNRAPAASCASRGGPRQRQSRRHKLNLHRSPGKRRTAPSESPTPSGPASPPWRSSRSGRCSSAWDATPARSDAARSLGIVDEFLRGPAAVAAASAGRKPSGPAVDARSLAAPSLWPRARNGPSTGPGSTGNGHRLRSSQRRGKTVFMPRPCLPGAPSGRHRGVGAHVPPAAGRKGCGGSPAVQTCPWLCGSMLAEGSIPPRRRPAGRAWAGLGAAARRRVARRPFRHRG
jgi:hypothetical protein